MITLSKIAKLAHVSVSTVSKAFSMSNEVNPETRERIFDIAKQHGCFKKYYRAKYPKHVIAVICPEFGSRSYSVALALIQKYLSEYNCEICVAATGFSEEKERELLEYYNRYTAVDGVIDIEARVKIDENIEIPVAAVNSMHPNNGVISVTNDNGPPLKKAIEYFTEKGVKDIGFISEMNTLGTLEKFSEVIKGKFGYVNEDLISVTDKRIEAGGYAAMEKFFSNGRLPRAIICAYDHMAIGAVRCIYDHGLKVPDDIAVMGMNDIGGAGEFLNPPLSSINTNMNKMYKIVTDALISHLMGEPSGTREKVVSELVLRKSTEI